MNSMSLRQGHCWVAAITRVSTKRRTTPLQCGKVYGSGVQKLSLPTQFIDKKMGSTVNVSIEVADDYGVYQVYVSFYQPNGNRANACPSNELNRASGNAITKNNSISILDYPFEGLKVSPGPAYAPNFNISLSPAIYAGDIFGASVLIQDASYNPIASSLIVPDALLLRSPIYDEGEIALESFSVPLSSVSGPFHRAATYSLSVSFSTILAGQGTINVFVSPGSSPIAACTVSGNVGGGHVSNPPTFLIIARCGFGNRITTGGDTFSISVRVVGNTEAIWISESAGQPVYGSGGSCTVTYSMTRRGAYSVAVTSGSTSITGSPMAVTFVDDSDTSALSPVAARYYPSGNGLYSAVLNMPSSFDLRLANIQNIRMRSGSFKANVVVTLNLEFSNFVVPVSINDIASSLISFSYTISSVGGYILSITLFGDHGQGSLQGSTSVDRIRASFSIQDDGYSTASWSPTVAGVYSLSVMHGAVQGAYVLKTYLGTADKTTALTVFPGAACASLSLANSNYLSLSTSGYISEFSVQCKDSYNNLRTVAVDKWIVRIKGNSSTNSEEQHDARVSSASHVGGSQVYQLGRYNALYRTTKSGAFAVNVMLAYTQGHNATYFRDLLYTSIAYNAIEFNTGPFSVTKHCLRAHHAALQNLWSCCP
jgi:hypothetical protein